MVMKVGAATHPRAGPDHDFGKAQKPKKVDNSIARSTSSVDLIL